MPDRYQALTATPVGRFAVRRLGLPNPVPLARFSPGDPIDLIVRIVFSRDPEKGTVDVWSGGRRTVTGVAENVSGAIIIGSVPVASCSTSTM